jgi:dienelactone hydrolase
MHMKTTRYPFSGLRPDTARRTLRVILIVATLAGWTASAATEHSVNVPEATLPYGLAASGGEQCSCDPHTGGYIGNGFHRFGAITPQPDRAIALELLGVAPLWFRNYFDIYPIDASTDLTHWTPLVMLVRTNVATDELVYMDAEASTLKRRFYRMPANPFGTALAKPTGPYAVGRTTRVLTDASRTNRYGIATNSSFLITIWYPAEHGSGVLPGAYIDPQLAAPLAEPHVGSTGDDANRLIGFFGFSLTNVPIALAESPYPVVIYSHGYSFHRQENSEKLEELASQGYVAVAMDHVDCRTTVYPDGRAIRGIFTDNPSAEALDASVAGRLADDRFVVEQLAQFDTDDALFAGRLDLTRLGAMGWSLGNSDLGETARTDERFKAVLMLEGYLQGAPELVQLGLGRPLLAMYQQDFSNPSLFNKATQDAYFCQVQDTIHFAFKDLTEESLAIDSVRRGAAAMRACMVSFFNKYLQGQDDHLLDDPTTAFPVLFNFASK